jgi:multisubunit Na+/H+ antiporter MnhC subunit
MKLSEEKKKKIKKIVAGVIGFAVFGFTGVVVLAVYKKIKSQKSIEVKNTDKV